MGTLDGEGRSKNWGGRFEMRLMGFDVEKIMELEILEETCRIKVCKVGYFHIALTNII